MNKQLINRIFAFEQPDVGLQPGAEVRTKLDQIFGPKRLLGSAVESLDMRPFQTHHVER